MNAAAHTASFVHETDCADAPTGINAGDIGPCADSRLLVDFSESLTADDDVGVVTVTFGFYLNVTDATGNQTGAESEAQGLNWADAVAEWDGNQDSSGGPVSADDDYQLKITNSDTAHDRVSNGTLRLQKWVDDGSGELTRNASIERIPGQAVRFILDFQVSDPSAFEDVVITDTLPDGLEYVENSVEFSYWRLGDEMPDLAEPLSNPTSQTVVDGAQVLVFDFNEFLNHPEDGSRLLGACIPTGGTGEAPDDFVCDAASEDGTRGIITFEAEVMTTYRDAANGDRIVMRDDFINTASMSGEILDVTDLSDTDINDTDGGSASVHIPGASTVKNILYVNGDTVGERPSVSGGDEVTFQLRVDLDTLTFRDFVVADYLPLPVFRAVTPSDTIEPCASGDIAPAVNTACYAESSDVQTRLSDLSVETSSSASANSVSFDFGSATAGEDDFGPAVLELLYTVEVAHTQLTDGLYLTNLVQAVHANSDDGEQISQQITQLRYTRPVLNITNGVIAITGSNIDNPNVSIPGVLQSGSGIDTGFRNDPVFNQDFENLDAGDRVTYLVIVENTGRGSNGAHEISLHEDLPAGIELSDVHDLAFFYGNGTPITPPANSDNLFTTGLDLPESVVIDRGLPDSGDDLVATGGNILYYT